MTASDISVDENTLRIIGQALTRLHQSNDPVSTEKLWILGDQADVTKLSFDDVDSLGSVLNGTKSIFRQLEATKNALFSLARSCEQRLSTLKLEMQPYFLQSGILSLPDNVLALIFENSLLVEDPYIQAERCISHVCRRFRSISFDLPKLWSHVTNCMSKEWLEIRLLRSKNTGLTVVIHDQRDGAVSRFAQQVVPHAHRWQDFMILTYSLSTLCHIFNQQLTDHFANLNLPALTHFYLGLNMPADDDSDFDGLEFYRSWEMPKLLHSRISYGIPTDAMYGSRTITSLDFIFARRILDFDSQKLMDFLGSLDNLTDLSLVLIDRDGHNYNAEIADLVVLPKVESFSLTTEIFEALEVMTTSVQMPALTKLSLDISADDDCFSARNWLYLVCMKEYPSVKDFTFIYRDYYESTLNLNRIFPAFPNAQSLTLDTSSRISYSSSDCSSLPPLRTLSLSQTSNMSSGLMEDLVGVFKRQGVWDGFETLEITDKRLLVQAKRSHEGEAEGIICYDKIHQSDR